MRRRKQKVPFAGADARPVFAGKVTVGQRLLNAVLDLLGGLLQLHGAQLGDHGLRLLAGRFLALLGVNRLEHFCHNFKLRATPHKKCQERQDVI